MPSTKSCHCPQIQDSDWHLQDLDWDGKFFYFDSLPHFFGIPLGYEKRLQQLREQIQHSGYQIVNPDLVLVQQESFNGKILIEIEDPQQYDANVEKFDKARVFVRVYQGPRNGLPTAIEELKAFALDRAHLKPNAVYHWRVTCPLCARERGGEKTVLFGRV